MIHKIAFRNVLRNLSRLRPVLIIFTGSFVLLTTVNALLQYTQQTFSRSYVEYLSGDAAVTEQTDTRFTLFGSDTVLIGEYLEPPVLIDPETLSEKLEAMPEVSDHAFLVTAPTRVEVGARRTRQLAFGVEFSSYRALFPQLRLLSGSWPADGSAAAVMQDHTYRRLFGDEDYAAHIGETLLLAGAAGDSFTLREVTLAGVYRYPVTDEVLRSVILVDATTVRSLAGYLSTTATTALPEEEESLLSGSVDDLFGETDDGVVNEPPADSQGSGTVLDELDALFQTPVDQPAAAMGDHSSGAWNFALVRSAENQPTRRLVRSLDAQLAAEHPYRVLDWRESVGGNVLIVYYVRVLANIGILCVALAAVIITTNSLVLSVLERTKEIGTMRALGAGKMTVTRILTLESVYLVFGSAFLGILLGSLLAAVIHAVGVPVDNQYLQILFGGGEIGASVTVGLIARQLGVGLVFAVFSLLYPLTKALRLTPIEAVNT